jgi:hypothetical protein
MVEFDSPGKNNFSRGEVTKWGVNDILPISIFTAFLNMNYFKVPKNPIFQSSIIILFIKLL